MSLFTSEEMEPIYSLQAFLLMEVFLVFKFPHCRLDIIIFSDLKWCFLVSKHSFCLWSNKMMPYHLNGMIMFACNSYVAHPWRWGHMMPCEIWVYMRSSGVFWLDSIWGASKVGGYELLALLQDLVQNLLELMHLIKHLVQNHLSCKFHLTNISNIPFNI